VEIEYYLQSCTSLCTVGLTTASLPGVGVS
jgi:hypothetical protein